MNSGVQYTKVRGIRAWLELVRFSWRYFSVWPLTKTLLAPFRRDLLSKRNVRFSFGERIIWNIFSRLFGAVLRLFLIILGIIFTFGVVLAFPIFLIPIAINRNKLYRHRALGRDFAFGFTRFLKQHSRDLARASETVLVGKQDVLVQTERVLARKQQNNVLLVGEPGVGRTTLVEHLAKRIAWGETLPPLVYRHIFELNLEGLTIDNVRRLFDEAARAGNIIVVVDNFHTYPGLPEIILPYTKISQMQIIGITNFAGYHQNLKFRTDLLQAFEKVEVKEPSNEETAALLVEIASSAGAALDETTAAEIVRLTNQLIHNVPQPEKAIDILEELSVGRKEIKVEDVQAILSQKTGVPVGKLSEEERDVLLNLEDLLRRYIVGQDKAIEGVARAIRRARSGVADRNRPVGSFLFLGPTGVGKTYTAQTLARIYYGSFESVVHFDMTEYSREESLGPFLEHLIIAMEENPFTLLLFDEIEKAHSVIINIFLQMLEEAHVTDSTGRKAHFNNAFVICTSNAGSELLMENPKLSKRRLIDYVVQNGIFRPEFLNRFDDIILFAPLSRSQAERIAARMLREFSRRLLKNRNIVLRYKKPLISTLAQKAYQSRFGAREIRRVLQDTVESYIADEVIKKNIGPGKTVTVPVEIVE